MSLVVREYSENDEKKWLKCHALVYLGSNERRMERNKPRYAKSIELVALVDDEIVSFLGIELEETPGSTCHKKLDGNGMLWDIGVKAESRRKGVATALLNEGIKRGKQLGMKRLEAWSIEPDAWKFYEKKGFKKFFEYHHVLIVDREKLRALDRDGLHVVELYAHVMPETNLEAVTEKHEPREIYPCCGFELTL